MNSKLFAGTFLMSVELFAGQAMSQVECDFLRIAKDHIGRKFPSFDPTGLTPVISESENLWELSYELPKGTLGGVPVITIDKRSCMVVRAHHSQ
jgi:hypothetical protein